MLKPLTLTWAFLTLVLAGCEETDLFRATAAGIDVVKAVTLSDQAVQELAAQSARSADSSHIIAPAENIYARRLQRLTGDHVQEGMVHFNYKVYLAEQVNAFAMADGTVRIYSGLMDMLDDDELRFVVGHEMGHVVKDHVRAKIQLAYAASAVRQGIASQNGVVGDFAASQLGGFLESLLNAQFSQLEEKEADDYGLSFLQRKGYAPQAAVAALRKLATLGDAHSFLGSHPAPGKRAERLELQLAGKALPVAELRQGWFAKLTTYLQAGFSYLYEKLQGFLPWQQEAGQRA